MKTTIVLLFAFLFLSCDKGPVEVEQIISAPDTVFLNSWFLWDSEGEVLTLTIANPDGDPYYSVVTVSVQLWRRSQSSLFSFPYSDSQITFLIRPQEKFGFDTVVVYWLHH